MAVLDAARAFVAAIAIAGIVWWLLIPRGWTRSLSVGERRVVGAFLIVRLVVMPLAFHAVGMASVTLFSGGTDADFYDQSGRDFSQDLLGSWPVAQPGTGMMRYSVAVFYWLAGPNRLAATFLWGALGTIGLLLFWLAAREFVPSRRVLFAGLALLMPSTLFWSAGLGKEAVVILGIGCLAMGFAQLHVWGRPWLALVYGVVGVFASGFMRPHVTAILLVAMLVGTVIIPSSSSKASLRVRWVASGAMAALLALAVPVAIRMLGPEPGESLLDLFYRRAEYAAGQQGGSAFEAYAVRAVTDIPDALGTVLLRPWPWEAHTIPQYAVVAESILMAGLFAWDVVLLAMRRARLVWTPMLVTSLVYGLLFAVAFSSYGNFGLLARERVQVTGFLLVALFSLRLVSRRSKDVST